ncbi:leucine rich repeat containing protein, partial [Entamoeba invadens IP1]
AYNSVAGAITTLSNYSTDDMQKAFVIKKQFDKGLSPNLFEKANPFIVSLVLKIYFTSLPQPFFQKGVVEDIMRMLKGQRLISYGSSPTLTSPRIFAQNKNDFLSVTNLDKDSDKSEKVTDESVIKNVKALLKEYLSSTDTQLVFNEVIETIKHMEGCLDKQQMTSCCTFFLDCFFPSFEFPELFVELFPKFSVLPKKIDIISMDSEESYDGETVKCVYPNVWCPLSVLTEPFTGEEVQVPGKLAVTSYRLVFIPSVTLDASRKAILFLVGQTPLNNIAWKKVSEHHDKQMLRIVTSTYTVMTFFATTKMLKNVDFAIDDALNEHMSIYINPLGGKLSESEVSERENLAATWKERSDRNKWTYQLNLNTDILPLNCPLFPTTIKCQQRGREIFVSCMLSRMDACVLRLTTPALKKVLTELKVDVEEIENVQIKEVYFHMKGSEEFEKVFENILTNVIYGKNSKEFGNYNELVGKANTLLNNCFNQVNEIMTCLNAGTNCLLLPQGIKETDVAIFTSLIQIIMDSYHRTINGFLQLLRCEFCSLRYDFDAQKHSFTFFIVALILIYKRNPSFFEFNQLFLEYIHHHSTSKLFVEFSQNAKSSIKNAIFDRLNYFKNPFYKKTEEVITINNTTIHYCNEIFFKSHTISPMTTAKLLQPCSNGIMDASQQNIHFFPLLPNFPTGNNTTRLVLSKNNITDFPTEFSQFLGLKELDLSDNKLSFLSDILSNMRVLTLLNISGNNLLNIDKSVSTLPLIELDLSSNDIQHPKADYFPTTLKRLFLRQNTVVPDLTHLQITLLDLSLTLGLDKTDFIQNLPVTLSELRLSGCALEHLPCSCSKLTELKKINLSKNKLYNLPPSFFLLTKITEINLKENPLRQISVMMIKLNNLEKMELDENVTLPTQLKSLFPERSLKEKLAKKNGEDYVHFYITGDDNQCDLVGQLIKKNKEKEKEKRVENGTTIMLEKFLSISVVSIFDVQMGVFVMMANSVFIVCEDNKNKTNPFERMLRFFTYVGVRQPIICVFYKTEEDLYTNEYDTVARNLKAKYLDLQIDFFQFDNLKPEKSVKELTKLMKETANETKVAVSQTCNKLIDEMQYIDMYPGITEVSWIKDLMTTMSIKEEQHQKFIEILQKLNKIYLFPTDSSCVIFNYSLMHQHNMLEKCIFCLVDTEMVKTAFELLLQHNCRTGLELTNMSELLGKEATQQQEHFFWDVLEFFHIVFVFRSEFFERLNLRDAYLSLMRRILLEKDKVGMLSPSKSQTMLKLSSIEIPIKTSFAINSASPMNVNHPKKVVSGSGKKRLMKQIVVTNDQKNELEKFEVLRSQNKKSAMGFLIFNYYGLSEKEPENCWKVDEKKEVEIGRVYSFNFLPLQFMMMFLSIFAVKHKLINSWRGGFLGEIVIQGSTYQAKVSFDFERMKVSIRLKIIVESEKSFLMTTNVWDDFKWIVESAQKQFSLMNSSMLIVCPHCLQRDSNEEWYTLTETQINEMIEVGTYSIVVEEHAVHFVLSCWDFFVKRLENNGNQYESEDFELTEVIAHGSSSTIKKCKVAHQEDKTQLYTTPRVRVFATSPRSEFKKKKKATKSLVDLNAAKKNEKSVREKTKKFEKLIEEKLDGKYEKGGIKKDSSNVSNLKTEKSSKEIYSNSVAGGTDYEKSHMDTLCDIEKYGKIEKNMPCIFERTKQSDIRTDVEIDYVVVKETVFDIKGMLMNGDDYKKYYINTVEEFIRECEFMKFPDSNYVAKIYGFILSPLCVVMEYFNGGSLFNYIAKHQTLSWGVRLQISMSIARGMELFTTRKQPLVHRDLKSPNIVLKVDEDQEITQVAITDFGQSMPTYGTDYKNCVAVECPFWLAPEVVNTSVFEVESDVYSFGMILWELSTLSSPFPQFKFMEEIRLFIKCGNLLQIPKSKIPEFDKLIEDCWKLPKQRPTFTTIVQRLSDLIKKVEV